MSDHLRRSLHARKADDRLFDLGLLCKGTAMKDEGVRNVGVQKRILIINGAERACLCDPEGDSLADVARRLGLTGTKVGCGAGQCGA